MMVEVARDAPTASAKLFLPASGVLHEAVWRVRHDGFDGGARLIRESIQAIGVVKTGLTNGDHGSVVRLDQWGLIIQRTRQVHAGHSCFRSQVVAL